MSLVNLPEDTSPSRDEVYQTLVRSLRRRRGFGIVFVQCSPAEARKIIQDLQQDLPQKQSANLSFDKPIDNLYDLVNELPNREKLNIVFIQGLEKSLEPYIKPGFGGDGDYYNLDTVPTILSHLNQRRELFRDHFQNICFVFFLPLFAIKYIIHRAPDFFDWSAGNFELSSEIDNIFSSEEVSIHPTYLDHFFDFSNSDQREEISFTQVTLDSLDANLVEELSRLSIPLEKDYGIMQLKIENKINNNFSEEELSIYPSHINYFLDSSNSSQENKKNLTLLTLDTNLVEELLREDFGSSQLELVSPSFLVSDTKQIRNLVNIIKQEIQSERPNGNLFLEDIRNALIRCLLRESPAFRDSVGGKNKDIALMTNGKIQLVKERLRENLRDNLKLEDFEEDTGISKFHISRSFQQAEGLSLTAYRRQIRVEQAQQLLINQPWSISRIAQECGFYDASHLNRCFKALTGMTPTQFRFEFQKKINIY